VLASAFCVCDRQCPLSRDRLQLAAAFREVCNKQRVNTRHLQTLTRGVTIAQCRYWPNLFISHAPFILGWTVLMDDVSRESATQGMNNQQACAYGRSILNIANLHFNPVRSAYFKTFSILQTQLQYHLHPVACLPVPNGSFGLAPRPANSSFWHRSWWLSLACSSTAASCNALSLSE
jgi:hypothetical protein